jgi:hypothetical protein
MAEGGNNNSQEKGAEEFFQVEMSKELSKMALEDVRLKGQSKAQLRDISAILQDINTIEEIIRNGRKEDAKFAAQLLANKKKELDEAKKKKKQNDEELKFQKDNAKFLGANAKIHAGINKLTGGILQGNNEITKQSEEQLVNFLKKNEAADGFTKALGAAKIVLGGIGMFIKSIKLDFSMLIDAAFKISSELKTIRQEMGLTYGQAYKLRLEIAEQSALSGDMVINTQRMLTTYGELNRSFGTASTLNLEMVSEATRLRVAMGLTEKAVGNIAKFSNISGKSIKEIKLDMIGSVKAVEAEFGARLNMREVMNEAAEVTGQMRAQLEANPATIAKTVAIAKELGMTIKDIAAASASLLEFETSIENELKAELLTGKELNLERARAAALAGDYATVAEEISKQVGNFNDFTKMNVLQQQALAAAVGMTADQLADQLLAKENLQQLAEEARAEGNEELARQLEARSMQEKFADAWMKIKGLIVDIAAGPISALLEGLHGILSVVAPIAQAIGYVLGAMARLATLDFENMSALQVIVGGIALAVTTIALQSKIAAAAQKLQFLFAKRTVIQEKLVAFFKGVSNRRAFMGMLRSGGQMIMEAFTAGAEGAPGPAKLIVPFIMAGIATAMVAGLLAQFGKGDDVMGNIGDAFPSAQHNKTGLVQFGPGGIEAGLMLNNDDNIVATTNPIESTPPVTPPPPTGGGGFSMEPEMFKEVMTEAVMEGNNAADKPPPMMEDIFTRRSTSGPLAIMETTTQGKFP